VFYLDWAFYAYLFVWVPFASSTALYALRSPWRTLPIGRALMTLLGSLTAVLTFVLFVLMVPIPKQAVDILRGLTLGAVGIAGWMLLRQIHVLQTVVKNEPDKCPRRRATDVP
jgi:hypothetical protein